MNLQTKGGKQVWEEALESLNTLEEQPALVWDDYLALAAEDHCKYTSARGGVSHEGQRMPNGDYQQPWDRVDKYGSWEGTVAESIAFGNIGGAEFMVELFIDDGVADKAHRDHILNSDYKKTGMAVCPHPKFG